VNRHACHWPEMNHRPKVVFYSGVSSADDSRRPTCPIPCLEMLTRYEYHRTMQSNVESANDLSRAIVWRM
jgi:hypothetical protein